MQPFAPQHDLTSVLAEYLQQVDPGRKQTPGALTPLIAPGDGMYSDGDGLHYLKVGHSALQMILQSLSSADRRSDSVRAILDYACGFGRVTRWLQSAFPAAHVTAADLDPKAIDAVSALMSVKTVQLTKDLSKPLPGSYDLIWIGSLFTHLEDDHTLRVLRFLRDHLTPIGIIVATTHGAYVAQRLVSRSKTYNVKDEDIARLGLAYRKHGTAFSAYQGSTDYGISIIRPDKMAHLINEAGFDMTFFRARGWAQHQDCFCLRRAAD